MRAVIYTGGELFPDRVSERPRADDLVIAADSGLAAARAFGVVPHILLGDFDSLGDPTAQGLPPSVEFLRVPAEKDDTDTQLAASVALARGATEVLVVGGFGGRPDHTLANIQLLAMLSQKGISAYLYGRDVLVCSELGCSTEIYFKKVWVVWQGDRCCADAVINARLQAYL